MNLKKLICKGKNYLDFLRLEQTKEALRFKEEKRGTREKRTDRLLSHLRTPFSGIPNTIAHIASLQYLQNYNVVRYVKDQNCSSTFATTDVKILYYGLANRVNAKPGFRILLRICGRQI